MDYYRAIRLDMPDAVTAPDWASFRPATRTSTSRRGCATRPARALSDDAAFQHIGASYGESALPEEDGVGGDPEDEIGGAAL